MRSTRRCRRRSPLTCGRAQAEHGGWPLYHNGELDLSCTVKAYYALKLAGDDAASAAHEARRALQFCSAAAPRGPMCSRE